ncbi:uncharacterized protein LTR77_005526 [Saxophila tyrrhenica]|uniref:Uncharacterized protein n=1 Tax=Saxophila tyrrhenica TaxID=1690608 RepID=A0AAV9PCV4_9PEZI|nr:hypothetical protein LTR77_005526 [Saxophila tyrrhenica]
MSSSVPLTLFPSAQQPQPRKSSLKKPRTYTPPSVASNELRGVAVRVNTTSTTPKLVVQPATDQFKHSLFCEPSSNGQLAAARDFSRKTRRRSCDGGSINSASPLIDMTTPVSASEGSTAGLPVSSSASQTEPTKGQLQRSHIPASISTPPQPGPDTLVSPGGDTVSPLPDRLLFSNTSPRQAEFPATKKSRAGSPTPTLVRSNSTSSTAVPPYSPPAARSIFPQYDPTRPLQEQDYYPSARAPTPTLAPTLAYESASKLEHQVQKAQTLRRLDSGVALVEGYQHIPSANTHDLCAIWNASHCNFPVDGRKVQLGLLQPLNRGTTLAIGTTNGEVLYSMNKDTAPATATATGKGSKSFKQLFIGRHNPQYRDAPPSPVAQLGLPDAVKPSKERENDVVTIFPQIAAVKAIETVANSPVAAEIATFDPSATSPEAARLAQDAVSEAHRRYRCELVRATRKRDSLGAVTASYKLEHPLLSSFAITITKSTAGRHSRDPRAKISLHHPSATPAAVEAETLVLAFLDFAHDACVLDVPGLLSLEGDYIIDTVVCALLAVAVIENDALMQETLTFDAPPTKALPIPKQKSRSTSSTSIDTTKGKKLSRKEKKRLKKGEMGEQVDLPMVTQGALALLSFSFKTTVFLLEAGVKVTAGLVIGVSHLASKGSNK